LFSCWRALPFGWTLNAETLQRRLRDFRRSNDLQETPHSSREETPCMEFIAVHVMAPICAGASREDRIFFALK
jgi:hypothetical protein